MQWTIAAIIFACPRGNSLDRPRQYFRLPLGMILIVFCYACTGGRKRDRVRRRLRMGINEVTRFLEAIAAPSGLNDSSIRNGGGGDGGSGGGGGGGSGGGGTGAGGSGIGGGGDGSDGGGGGAIVIISGDVRPARLVEHLHALVALTGGVKKQNMFAVVQNIRIYYIPVTWFCTRY